MRWAAAGSSGSGGTLHEAALSPNATKTSQPNQARTRGLQLGEGRGGGVHGGQAVLGAHLDDGAAWVGNTSKGKRVCEDGCLWTRGRQGAPGQTPMPPCAPLAPSSHGVGALDLAGGAARGLGGGGGPAVHRHRVGHLGRRRGRVAVWAAAVRLNVMGSRAPRGQPPGHITQHPTYSTTAASPTHLGGGGHAHNVLVQAAA